MKEIENQKKFIDERKAREKKKIENKRNQINERKIKEIKLTVKEIE